MQWRVLHTSTSWTGSPNLYMGALASSPFRDKSDVEQYALNGVAPPQPGRAQ
jgi:hypothetical protein